MSRHTKTKKKGPLNYRKIIRNITRRANRENATLARRSTNNNNNNTVSYNSNNMNNNMNEEPLEPYILESALRIPEKNYERKTVGAKPINMTAVKEKIVKGKPYLVHKRTGNIWAPAFKTRIHNPLPKFGIGSLNNGTSYNASRAFPVQIRSYNMTKKKYKNTNKALNIKTRENYANRHGAEIIYIQQSIRSLIEQFQGYNSRGLLTEQEKNEIFNDVKQHIINMYTVHVKNNTVPTEELPENIRRAREFQDNVFEELEDYVRQTLTYNYANDKQKVSQYLQTLIYVYHVFVIEKLHDKDIAYLVNPPPELEAIMFPQGWYLDYKIRSIV